MSPLNSLMNFSANLSQKESFFKKQFSSRVVNVVCVPLEMLAVFENVIKLPFQAVTLSIKIPAKIVNVVIRSKSLTEFESALASPLQVIKTALKIIGYVIGSFFTLTVGTISPRKNLKIHCAFGLAIDNKAKKAKHLAEQEKMKEIDAYEKALSARLNRVIDAMRKKTEIIIPDPTVEADPIVEAAPIEDVT